LARVAACGTIPEFWPGHCSRPTRWSARPTHRPRRCPQRDPMSVNYEVTYILRPTLEEADADARVETIAEGLKANGGEVEGEIEKMGKRRLAYEIDDLREGYYVVMKFKSNATASKELERQMRLNDDVLRHLVIKLDD
jgi:small subunit ribosomal protein S6